MPFSEWKPAVCAEKATWNKDRVVRLVEVCVLQGASHCVVYTWLSNYGMSIILWTPNPHIPNYDLIWKYGHCGYNQIK